MAVDATGAPTTLFSIPKFNVNADAPSGLGGNAQMDSIDTLLANLGIAGLVANDVPVYDSVAGKFKKASGSHTGTNFLRDDGSWASAMVGKITTSTLAGGPPGSPSDGDIWVATAVDANGLRWTFQYNAGSASAFKWEFIGGGSMRHEVDAAESFTASGYADLTTVGPQITLARAGDYVIRQGAASAGPQSAGAGFVALMSYDVGATGAIDADAAVNTNSVNAAFNNLASVSRERRKTAISAGATITCKYRNTAGTTTLWQWRWMSIQPVRIS